MTGRRAVVTMGAAALYLVLPLRASDYWLAIFNLAGMAAIGASSLNLLTGYTGQLSLGHAAFLGAGAYTAAAVSGPHPVWMAAALLVGAALGLIVAPFAVRLRGHTLAIATLAVVFVAQHVFRGWTSVTGGNAGRSDLPSPSLPGSHDQGWFWLVWPLVGLTVVLVRNIARSRAGRAMLAVRDDEHAARVAGIDVARTKVAAFVASGALASAAGALYGSYRQYVGPEDWGLLVSIQYLAMVLIGGLGTVYGPVLGAVFVVAVPRLAEELVPMGSAAQVNQLVFGLLIVAVVLARARRWRLM